MEINKFISKVLDELQDLKTNDNKKRYIVQDLEFELSVAISKDGKGKLEVSNSFLGFEAKGDLGGGISKEDIQKVKIKLKPIGQTKNSRQIVINT
jgi:hypothetical protein